MSEETKQNVRSDAPDWKPPSREEWEKVTRALSERNQEAAENRRKAEAEAAGKGELQSLVDQERTEKEKLAGRVKELEPYQQTVAQELAELKKELGADAAVVEGLSETQSLRILRTLRSKSAGPGAAHRTTAGNPARPAMTPDLASLNPAERKRYLHSLPHDELVKLAGGHGSVSPLAAPLKR